MNQTIEMIKFFDLETTLIQCPDMSIEEIAKRIREARRAAKMTQAQLSEKSGVSRPVIGNIETLSRGLTLENIIALAKALGKDPGYFLAERWPSVIPEDASEETLLVEIHKDNLLKAQVIGLVEMTVAHRKQADANIHIDPGGSHRQTGS